MRTKTILTCVLATLIVATTAAARDRGRDDYKKHPGYVEFETLNIFADEEAKVDVYLKQPMLELVSKFAKQEDPELFETLSKLKLVRVQVFDVDRMKADEFGKMTAQTVKALDDKGWERIVRVREDEKLVYVYLKPSEDYEWIQGIVVLAMDDDDEAVFVNIVGDIHPDDINKLGHHFGVEELDSIRYEMKKGN